MIKKITVLTAISFLIINLYGQDKYVGDFSDNQFFLGGNTKIPIGNHIGYDEDEGLEIAIKYGKNASIKSVAVLSGNDTVCFEQLNFPNKKTDWIEIKKGLWNNSVDNEEELIKSFSESDEIKMHYAGFLKNENPFDNSFIRNKPLIGKLKWFIKGFAIGAINVKPNTLRIIKISPELAYGSKGGGNIPPNSTIYYVIYNLENPIFL